MQKVEAWEDGLGNLHSTEEECLKANMFNALYALLAPERCIVYNPYPHRTGPLVEKILSTDEIREKVIQILTTP